ncbi:hypothetical protein AAHN93_02515 [Vandammella animalimorsus]|uniref:hypothetical protein n=1 Tax=Vandammella animalimorsus TaxID=2029117 RepID=UPI0031BA25A3
MFMKTKIASFLFLSAASFGTCLAQANSQEILSEKNLSKIGLNKSFVIPSDPGATYKILSIKRKGGIAEISSERQGKIYLGYTKREFDCKKNLTRYIAEGETKQDLEKSNPDKWGPIVDGSIAYWQGKIACNKSGK